jgi:hypothetical protein
LRIKQHTSAEAIQVKNSNEVVDMKKHSSSQETADEMAKFFRSVYLKENSNAYTWDIDFVNKKRTTTTLTYIDISEE